MIAIEPVRQLGHAVTYLRGSTPLRGVSELGQTVVTPALYARHAIEYALKTNRQLFERMGQPVPRYGSRSRIDAHPTLFDAVLRYALNWARIPSYPKMYYWPTPSDRYIIRNAQQIGTMSQSYLTDFLNSKYSFFRAAEYVRPPTVTRRPQPAARRAAALRRQPTAAERFRAGIVAQQQRALAIQQSQPAREAARQAQEAERQARWKASEEAFEARHEIIAQEIAIEREAKRQEGAVKLAIYQEKKRKAAAYKQEVEARRRVQQAEKAARKKAAEDLAQERRRIAAEERKAESQALVAAHPQQPGSPPISRAIAEVAAGYAITPGALDPAAFGTFRRAVIKRAKQLRSQMYYHRPGRGKTKYFYIVDDRTVDRILKQEGYTIQAAYPGPTVIRPTVAQPGRLPERYTTSPDDPMIQMAVEQVILESGLRSGEEVMNIAAFQRLVAAKTREFAPAAGRQARPSDITAAVDARVRFILHGVAS